MYSVFVAPPVKAENEKGPRMLPGQGSLPTTRNHVLRAPLLAQASQQPPLQSRTSVNVRPNPDFCLNVLCA